MKKMMMMLKICTNQFKERDVYDFYFLEHKKIKTRERAKLSKIQQRETKKNLRMMLRLLDEKENDQKKMISLKMMDTIYTHTHTQTEEKKNPSQIFI